MHSVTQFPFSTLQSEIPTKEWCYPQWVGLPTAPPPASLEAYLLGDSRVCQVDNSC